MTPRKLRLIITVDYEGNPEDYDTSDADEMAEIDEENFGLVGLDTILSKYFSTAIEADDYTIRVFSRETDY